MARILYVEDELDVAALVLAYLADQYTVTHVTTLHAAIAVVSADHDYQAIVLDLLLPDRVGLRTYMDMFAAVKGFSPPVPIVVLTGTEVVAGLDFPGGGRYVYKPEALPDNLLTALAAVISG